MSAVQHPRRPRRAFYAALVLLGTPGLHACYLAHERSSDGGLDAASRCGHAAVCGEARVVEIDTLRCDAEGRPECIELDVDGLGPAPVDPTQCRLGALLGAQVAIVRCAPRSTGATLEVTVLDSPTVEPTGGYSAADEGTCSCAMTTFNYPVGDVFSIPLASGPTATDQFGMLSTGSRYRLRICPTGSCAR